MYITDDLDLDARGFPSSDFLLQRGCQLGRNARMLASQTPERIADKGNVSELMTPDQGNVS